MIKIICDKCGCECGLSAFVIRVWNIYNLIPAYLNDTTDPKLNDSEKIQLTLCQDCYKKIGIPDLHKAVNDRKLEWRNK